MKRIWQLLALCSAFALSSLLAAAADATSERIVYPRGSEKAEASNTPASSRSTLVLLALGVAAAGAWWWWMQKRGVAKAGGRQSQLTIAESRALGNRQHLVVADYAGKKFLLGVCPGRIEMLARIDDEDGAEDIA